MTSRSSASLFNCRTMRTWSVDWSVTSISGGSLRGEHYLRDALDNLRLVGGVGDARDVDGLRAARRRARLPGGANADGAAAAAVDLAQLVGRVQHLPAGGEVGAGDELAQRVGVELRVVQKLQQRRAHLVGVVRRNVRGHADGDAGGAVDQQVGQPRRQHHRLLPRAVVVGPERHGPPVELGQQLGASWVEPAFRVAHGRGAVAVQRAEVADAFHQGIAHGERLRQPHQRVVDGRVAVRVVAAHHVAHHLRALARLGV